MPFFYQWSTLPRIWLKWNCSKHKIKIFCQRRSYYRVLDKLDPSLGKSEKMLTLLNSWSGQCFMSKIIWRKEEFKILISAFHKCDDSGFELWAWWMPVRKPNGWDFTYICTFFWFWVSTQLGKIYILSSILAK